MGVWTAAQLVLAASPTIARRPAGPSRRSSQDAPAGCPLLRMAFFIPHPFPAPSTPWSLDPFLLGLHFDISAPLLDFLFLLG